MFNNLKTDGIGTGVVIWQSKNTQVAQGGFTLDDATLAVGTIVPAGTPIGFDEATRLAKPLKSGVAQANATNTATAYKVLKGHLLKVGMTIIAGAGTGRSITEIDTTDPAFDLLTVGTTIGVAVTAGDPIYVADLGFTPKGLLYESVVIGANGLAEATVVLRGTVYARRIVPVSAVVRAKLPLIIFSESF
jgi:hypothetical protein